MGLSRGLVHVVRVGRISVRPQLPYLAESVDFLRRSVDIFGRESCSLGRRDALDDHRRRRSGHARPGHQRFRRRRPLGVDVLRRCGVADSADQQHVGPLVLARGVPEYGSEGHVDRERVVRVDDEAVLSLVPKRYVSKSEIRVVLVHGDVRRRGDHHQLDGRVVDAMIEVLLEPGGRGCV